MALLPILQYPDPRLRKKAVSVAEITDGHRRLIADMLETMYADGGVGLAATQVNIQERIVVIDISAARDQPQVFINPEILHHEGSVDSDEGCLSIPGIFCPVKRYERIQLTARSVEGEPIEFTADGFLAICLQHELDHLDGILFVDHLSPLKREIAMKKLAKLRRQVY